MTVIAFAFPPKTLQFPTCLYKKHNFEIMASEDNDSSRPGLGSRRKSRMYVACYVFVFIGLLLGLIFCATGLAGPRRCAYTLDSADFSIKSKGSERELSGNGCPGYDWSSQSTPNPASELEFDWKIPLEPKI